MNRSCSSSVSRAGALRVSFGACSPALMRAAPEDRLGLDVVDAFAEQGVGDLVGDASDVAVHGFAFRVSENKLADVLPRFERGIHTVGEAHDARAFLSANSGKLVE